MAEQMFRRDIEERQRTLARRFGGVLCVLVGAGMLLLFFWPRGEDVRLLMLDLWSLARSWGLPEQVSPEAFAVVANGLVFVPLAFVLTLLVRRVSPWVWGLSGFAIGGGIELVQLVAMDGRVPELMDAGANGFGAVLGATAGHVLLRKKGDPRAIRTEPRAARGQTETGSAEPVQKPSIGDEGHTGRPHFRR